MISLIVTQLIVEYIYILLDVLVCSIDVYLHSFRALFVLYEAVLDNK